MRNRFKPKCYTTVAARIGRLYGRLCEMSQSAPAPAGYLTRDDVLHETICFLIHDACAAAIKADSDFVCYFARRYEMISFQISFDYKQLKEIHYADNLQAGKEPEE